MFSLWSPLPFFLDSLLGWDMTVHAEQKIGQFPSLLSVKWFSEAHLLMSLILTLRTKRIFSVDLSVLPIDSLTGSGMKTLQMFYLVL